MTTDMTQEKTTDLQQDATQRTYVPYTDMKATSTDTVLELEMPGVGDQSVDVNLDRHILTVKGAAGLTPPEGLRLVRQEFENAHYVREFELTHDVDQARIRAAMKNGVLTVTIPKGEVARARKIPITTE